MRNHLYSFYINAIPFLVSLLPSIFAIPIYLEKLGAHQLGVYYLYLSVVGIGAAFDLGISQTIIKYVAAYKDKSSIYIKYIIDSSKIVLCLILLILLLLFVLFSIGSFLFNINLPVLLCLIFFIGLTLQFFLNFELSIFKGYERYRKIAIFESAHKLGFTLLGLTACYFFKNVVFVLMGHVFMSLILLLYFYFITRDARVFIRIEWIKRYLFFFKRVLFNYSKWVFIQNLSGYLNGNIDKFVVTSFVNVTALASYNTTQNLTGVAQGFIAKGLSYLLPYASQIEDKERLRTFFINGNMTLSSFLGVIYIVGSFISAPIIYWYLKNDLKVANEVIQYFDILLISSLFNCTALLSWHLFNGMGEIKINTSIPLIFSILVILLMILFGFFYGVWGILYAKLFGVFFSIIVRTISYNKIFNRSDYTIGVKLVMPLIVCIALVKCIKLF